MDFKADYYKILGVELTAKKAEIKAAHRALVKKYHPDSNSGNPGDNTEAFRKIQEAYEILSNDAERFVYDEFRRKTAEVKAASENKKKDQQGSSPSAKYKRTYKRTRTEATEYRVYLKGEMTARFRADQENGLKSNMLNEIHYLIDAYDVHIDIKEKDIYPFDSAPDSIHQTFKEAALFRSKISQPVKCSVTNGDEIQYFELVLNDIHIRDPRIEGITKHEGQNFGTLKGDICGYVQHFEYKDITEEVTECFGETGRIERKAENNTNYYRKEYYHSDCTVYWGDWIAIPVRKEVYTRPKRATPVYTSYDYGCAPLMLALVFFLLVLYVPQLLLVLLPMFLILMLMALFSGAPRLMSPLFSIIGGILFLWFIIWGIKGLTGKSSYVKNRQEQTRRNIPVKTSHTPIVRTNPKKERVNDSLISHYIAWNDYDSNKYAAEFSIYTSSLRSSIAVHRSLNSAFYSKESFGEVYSLLSGEDDSKLSLIYKTLDSIRTDRNLSRIDFSKMIVSCIQSFPFALVMDGSCDEPDMSDEFTVSFLSACRTDCCVGNEKYGVRSPIEFLSDLKGDCDTRCLLLYTILKHYQYDVVLLTSIAYKHALIGVNFDDAGITGGASMTLNGRPYYLWETTSAGFKPGVIPPDISDLNNWEVTLLNKE